MDLPARKVSSSYEFDAIPNSALSLSGYVTFSDSVDLPGTGAWWVGPWERSSVCLASFEV